MNFIEEIQALLDESGKIVDKHKTIAQATGSSFNIFETTNISENEVRMCRVLTEFLNPEGTHYQGHIYLDLFFEIVLKREVPSKSIKVERELVIEGDRRIDLVINCDDCVIPIEVKINACDQPNQLYDYAKKSKVKEGPKVYYLTKFGSPPSENSCCSYESGDKKLEENDLGYISWEIHILEWIEACISHHSTVTRAPIREILLQFASAVRKFTGQLEENEKMEIEELLLKSPESMKNAHNIESAFGGATKKLLNKFRQKLVQELINYCNPNEKDYAGDVMNDWNIGYILNKENNDSIRVARISYENGKVIKLIQVLNKDWSACPHPISKPTEEMVVFSLTDDAFFNLVDDKKLEDMVDNCVNWISNMRYKK